MQRDIVLILLTDSQGRFLLQHRSNDAPTYPGFWGFFGGGIEELESPFDAIKRESFEELRYTPNISQPVLSFEYNDSKTGRFGKKFYFSEDCLNKDSLELHEGQAMGWFTLEDARSLKITDSNLSTIETIIKMKTEQDAAANP